MSATRAPKLVNYLLAQGHDVQVLAPAHDRFPPLYDPAVPESRLHRTPSWDVRWPPRYVSAGAASQAPSKTLQQRVTQKAPSSLRHWLSRAYRSVTELPDPSIGWYPWAVRAGLRLAKGWMPDLIYGTAPPHSTHLVARRLSRRLGVPWVAELRDLWTDDPYYHHPPQPRWRAALERRMEAWALAQASGFVAVTEGAAERLRTRFEQPVTVVMNGFDPADFDDSEVGPRAASAEPLQLVYTGTLYAGRRDPSLLFQALALEKSLEGRIHVSFYGADQHIVHTLAQRFGVGDVVTVYPTVPRKQALRVQQQADVLLLLTWPDVAEQGVIPAKVFDYIGARHPILAVGNENGEAAQIIKRHHFGMASGSPTEIAATLMNLCQQKAKGVLASQADADAHILFQRSHQFAHLDAFLVGRFLAETGLR